MDEATRGVLIVADSLQDQLKALGLAKSKPTAKPSRKRGKPNKTRAAKKSKKGELSLEQAYALKRREEQSQADKARKKKQAEDRQRRLVNNKIRDIVKANRLNRKEAEIARNFLFRGRIRKVHVTPEQLSELNAGKLGLVYLSGGYHLLNTENVEIVRDISAEHVVDLDTNEGDDGDFPVPDDLNW